MSTPAQLPILLFSYGTLQDKPVQLANFGRELKGRRDAMPGYVQTGVEIVDPQVLATSGKTHHPIIKPGTDPCEEIAGTVFEISQAELEAADRYEVADYKRVSVIAAERRRAGHPTRAPIARGSMRSRKASARAR